MTKCQLCGEPTDRQVPVGNRDKTYFTVPMCEPCSIASHERKVRGLAILRQYGHGDTQEARALAYHVEP